MRVLIADDSPSARSVLTETLTAADYDVIAAIDGNEAWRTLLHDDDLSLAVVDWEMPNLDGVDLCRRIRAVPDTAGVYVIMVTSRDQRADLLRGLRAGADDYLTKPFDKEELLARVRIGERIARLQLTLTNQVEQLKAALREIKTLQGILPICMFCKKIRTDDEAWLRLEAYIERHSEAKFSHGLCPKCYDEHYPEE